MFKSNPKESNNKIKPVTSIITRSNRKDHLLARIGINRNGHRVEAGLYSLGSPTPDSPVFVTANYTLSFDALRRVLTGTDCYIMVVETYGINVWCAAGKGTFGTKELVHRIKATNLNQVVRHHLLILPQLGAAGVSAHEVKKSSGFKVEFGPVRASDLPEYLKTHRVAPEMRRVRFELSERLIVAVVDLVRAVPYLVIVAALTLSWGQWFAFTLILTSIISAVVLFPILLPYLPTRDFSSKGFILGTIVMLPFALTVLLRHGDLVWWLRGLYALTPVLIFTPVTAYLTLNFTGSTTFTSRTGVRREISTYIPIMAWCFGSGLALSIILYFLQNLGGA